MEKKFENVVKVKTTQELIDIYNHAGDYQEEFVKEVYDELTEGRGLDKDRLFLDRERFIQEQNKFIEQGKRVTLFEMILYPLWVIWMEFKDFDDTGDEDLTMAELVAGIFIILIMLARPVYIASAKIGNAKGVVVRKYDRFSRIYAWILIVLCGWPLPLLIFYMPFLFLLS